MQKTERLQPYNRDQDVLAQALAEPTRRAILENLRSGQKTVTELVKATQRKQPNLSNHLAKMRGQGLVRAERLGRQVFYSLGTPFADAILRFYETAANAIGAENSSASAASGDPLAPSTQATPESVGAQWGEKFLQGLLSGQEEPVLAIVNAMLSQRIDMLTIYSEVFQPALFQIGTLYERGELTVAQEHLASAHTERMMAKVAQFYVPVTRIPRRAVFGCVANNWHVIGLRMLADGLRIEGWETLFLGANVPTTSFVNMVSDAAPDLVVISCALDEHLPVARELIEQLSQLRAARPDQKFLIAVGGNHLFTIRETIQEYGADLMAPDLRSFLNEIHRTFTPSL